MHTGFLYSRCARFRVPEASKATVSVFASGDPETVVWVAQVRTEPEHLAYGPLPGTPLQLGFGRFSRRLLRRSFPSAIDDLLRAALTAADHLSLCCVCLFSWHDFERIGLNAVRFQLLCNLSFQFLTRLRPLGPNGSGQSDRTPIATHDLIGATPFLKYQILRKQCSHCAFRPARLRKCSHSIVTRN